MNNRVFRKYARDNQNRPFGVAVAKLSEDNKTISFGFAQCSVMDSFNYDRGCSIADGRLSKGKYTRSVSSGPFSIEDLDYESYGDNTLLETFGDIASDIVFVLNDAYQYARYISEKNK